MEAALAAAARAAQAAAGAAARWAHVSGEGGCDPRLVLADGCSSSVERLCSCRNLIPVLCFLPSSPSCVQETTPRYFKRREGPRPAAWSGWRHSRMHPQLHPARCPVQLKGPGSMPVNSAVEQAAWAPTSRPWPLPVLSLLQTSLVRTQRVWWWTILSSCRPAGAASTS